MSAQIAMLEGIERETDRRRLLSLACCCQGDMRSGKMESEYYGQCMVALTRKLGFPLTSENLKRAVDECLAEES